MPNSQVVLPATGAGTATPPIATQLIAGKHYELIKLVNGLDGDATVVETDFGVGANGLRVTIATDQPAIPVSGPLTDTQLRTTPVPVSGTVAITSATLATEATLSALNAKVVAVNTGAVVVSSSVLPAGAATSALQQTNALTDTELRATPVPVSGTVTVVPPANQSINLVQVAGAAIAQGHGLAATAIRVELPTDGTGTVVLAAGAAVIGHVIVDSGVITTVSTVTAVTAITTALPTGTNVLGRVGIDQTTPGTTNLVALAANQSINLNQVNGAAISLGHGTAATAIRVELPTDGTGVIATVGAVTAITNALPTGANLVGYVGQQNTYANLTNLTTTNFSGLTTTNAWQSVAIDSGGARDIHFEFQTVGAAGSTAYVDFYIAETLSNGTVYTDGATGTEGTFTAANRKNSRYLGSLLCNGTSAVQACMKLSDIFAVIPKKFAIIAINNSGGTISATGGNTVFDWAKVN